MISTNTTAYTATAKHLAQDSAVYLARCTELTASAKQDRENNAGKTWDMTALRATSQKMFDADQNMHAMMNATRCAQHANMRAYQHNQLCTAKTAHHNALCKSQNTPAGTCVPLTLAQVSAVSTRYKSKPGAPPWAHITRPLTMHRASNAPNAQRATDTDHTDNNNLWRSPPG